ncbi:MAG: CHAD domain-containing protein [Chthoniobacterales bacterium]|nr:CHAD domain-containing protein [Chthoniobacterales bacterium]
MARSSRTPAPGPSLLGSLYQLLREASRAVEKFPGDPAGMAHLLRTRVKRLQSLCRLVPRGEKWRDAFLPPCRDLKDLFAETRDATIVQGLAERYAPGEARHLRVAAPPDLARAEKLIASATKVLGDYVRWDSIEWKDIADRAVGTYRAARGAWRAAEHKNAPDAEFHDWRRRVKRLLYQCEYLGGRARLVRFTRRVDRLGEILGEIQDVCMAEDWLKKHRTLSVPPDLARTKQTLRREALRRGPVLLSPRPREFRDLLG